MKELLVISGKGGAGKTSITAALAALAGPKVLVDLDVDAPDMHLLLQPKPWRTEPFLSGNLAVTRREDCTGCGLCAELCAFGAARLDEGGLAVIDESACEGCKLCVAMCPAQAIDFPPRDCGDWHVSDTRLGPLVHALLHPGAENSGRLISLLRDQARQLAQERGLELIIADGSPGVGCPVISSLSGCNLALCVTEPTPSGLHDLGRVLELCAHFKVMAKVVVNKADLNPDMAVAIEEHCAERGLECLGRLPFDPQVVEAASRGLTIVEHDPNGPTSREMAGLWEKLGAAMA